MPRAASCTIGASASSRSACGPAATAIAATGSPSRPKIGAPIDTIPSRVSSRSTANPRSAVARRSRSSAPGVASVHGVRRCRRRGRGRGRTATSLHASRALPTSRAVRRQPAADDARRRRGPVAGHLRPGRARRAVEQRQVRALVGSRRRGPRGTASPGRAARRCRGTRSRARTPQPEPQPVPATLQGAEADELAGEPVHRGLRQPVRSQRSPSESSTSSGTKDSSSEKARSQHRPGCPGPAVAVGRTAACDTAVLTSRGVPLGDHLVTCRDPPSGTNPLSRVTADRRRWPAGE
jgi:hypothetical protein